MAIGVLSPCYFTTISYHLPTTHHSLESLLARLIPGTIVTFFDITVEYDYMSCQIMSLLIWNCAWRNPTSQLLHFHDIMISIQEMRTRRAHVYCPSW
jgi:hypothetical protein